jgi:hypothetical protein
VRSAILGIAFLLGGCPVHAYEDDVHYGLTKWLALAAGMTVQDAETVAIGNKEADGGALDAISLVFFNACIGRDRVGSELVQTHHFPGQGPVPGPAKERVVVADSLAARTAAEDRIKNPRIAADGSTWNLRRFGLGLHAYQDSFAHQGEPDIPGLAFVRCDRTLAWGHPTTRPGKGWDSHDADLTYRDRSTAQQMARGTYDLICNYRKQVQSVECPRPWSDLAAAVDRFIVASTKADKWRWFSSGNPFSKNFPSCDFLKDIDLDDPTWNWCSEIKLDRVDTSEKLLLRQESRPSREIEAAANPAPFVRVALETWFVRRDVFSLATNYIDRDSFKFATGLADFGAEDVLGAGIHQLSAWLVKDHGSVRNRVILRGSALIESSRVLGANTQWRGGPNPSPAPGATITLPKGTLLVNYKSLEEALHRVDSDHELFDVRRAPCQDKNSECALAAAKPRHAPYKLLLIELQRKNGAWKIVKWWPYVDH